MSREAIDELRDDLRDEVIRCAMAYTFGDYPDTDDLSTKADALAALEAACMNLEEIEKRRGK